MNEIFNKQLYTFQNNSNLLYPETELKYSILRASKIQIMFCSQS